MQKQSGIQGEEETSTVFYIGIGHVKYKAISKVSHDHERKT